MEQKYYQLNDLVRADCHDCAGCSACCKDMGDSIHLDPYDIYQIQKHGGCSMAELFEKGMAALTVWRGLIVPCLQMRPDTGACGFLHEGRCSIHSYRPGICRSFPLGRNFDEGGMTYFLLEDACGNRSRSKIKVSRWLGVQPAEKYHEFVLAWHDFRHELLAALKGADEQREKRLNMDFIRRFYLSPYKPEHDFYAQFYGRAKELRESDHFA